MPERGAGSRIGSLAFESHLASNIHKSRLVQQDLQVAKRLQEEEDLRAKARIQRHQKDIPLSPLATVLRSRNC
ncbi:hypothetical protein JZ751_019119 [Albula glossodonta]|uniref:Coiled-coil domain-containing protein n=1 Tax=Albula glossodonta TaxID=121402 RepID=A0A8T2NLF1_9TELE|nr:hypothetical protein JZ751_019119 [Albula glossodonta]